ncbi:hypothetical protein [Halobacillus sp. Marseille-Q1614]|uniref:hypothetical protein n=1 Tax=Halobacillus sp. Marseille-Q1614 TaxID=2709134 RepID=UPI00156D80A5|nr:hypothetical protein [Halobacillus sp. Marseille-Q1614]
MNRKQWIGLGILITLTAIVVFGPYSVVREFNEKGAVKEFIGTDNTFQGLKITKIDYRGSDTYFIQTEEEGNRKNFILMRHYTSVMNGQWKVFEQTGEEGHY